jgi:hypothetical protein
LYGLAVLTLKHNTPCTYFPMGMDTRKKERKKERKKKFV